MTIFRSGRPTVRVLREDLGVTRLEDDLDAHSPLSEWDHPLIRKLTTSFGANPADDQHEGSIRSSRRLRLLEIKQSQWRGGVWIDEASGQPWLVTAGLAKGEHKDHDDFYVQVEAADKAGTSQAWLPTARDQLQLKRETAAALVLEWRLRLQAAVLDALEPIANGGEINIELPHPKEDEPAMGTATLTVELIREHAYNLDELLLEVNLSNEHKGSNLGWTVTLGLLAAVHPIETAWDWGSAIFSVALDKGRVADRIVELRVLVEERELPSWVPNGSAHRAHRQNLAEATVEGKGVRAMCGIFFVPSRDHVSLPHCETCDREFESLP